MFETTEKDQSKITASICNKVKTVFLTKPSNKAAPTCIKAHNFGQKHYARQLFDKIPKLEFNNLENIYAYTTLPMASIQHQGVQHDDRK